MRKKDREIKKRKKGCTGAVVRDIGINEIEESFDGFDRERLFLISCPVFKMIFKDQGKEQHWWG